jgi:hypothetical protein
MVHKKYFNILNNLIFVINYKFIGNPAGGCEADETAA